MPWPICMEMGYVPFRESWERRRRERAKTDEMIKIKAVEIGRGWRRKGFDRGQGGQFRIARPSASDSLSNCRGCP